MKTTTRISLLFVLFWGLVIFLFWGLLNILFLTQRYNTERNILRTEVQRRGEIKRENDKIGIPTPPGRRGLWSRFTKLITVESDDEIIQKALKTEHKFIANLLHVWDERLLYKKKDNKIVLSRVTPFMERQLALLKLTTLWGVVFLLLWFLLAKWFAHRALRDLDTLSSYVDTISTSSLHHSLNLSHLPEWDKIKNVSQALTRMQSSLHTEFQRIKRFVSNVSHEFKTPFMVMQSWSELSLASWNHKQGLEENITQIKRLNTLLGTLTWLTHAQKIEETPEEIIELAPLSYLLLEETDSQYNKNQSVIVQIDKDAKITWHRPSLEIILKNLIDNAYKYSKESWEIKISYDSSSKTISVLNTWPIIQKNHLDHIREPFRQADSSKELDTWFGLWLALVKELCVKNWWEIDVESGDGKTEFKVTV